jgi:hypothetical protein
MPSLSPEMTAMLGYAPREVKPLRFVFGVEMQTPTQARTGFPSASPSITVEGGVARRVARMDVRNFAVRPGMACLQSPPGARSTGDPSGRCRGRPSLWLLSLGRARESDLRAGQPPASNQSVASATQSHKPNHLRHHHPCMLRFQPKSDQNTINNMDPKDL